MKEPPRVLRRRSPATLAANVTENVAQILWQGRVFHLSKPIDLTIEREGAYYVIGYQPLGITGYGHSEREALESFADDFSFTWDTYGMARDGDLTQDARDLKQNLRRLVARVAA